MRDGCKLLKPHLNNRLLRDWICSPRPLRDASSRPMQNVTVPLSNLSFFPTYLLSQHMSRVGLWVLPQYWVDRLSSFPTLPRDINVDIIVQPSIVLVLIKSTLRTVCGLTQLDSSRRSACVAGQALSKFYHDSFFFSIESTCVKSRFLSSSMEMAYFLRGHY